MSIDLEIKTIERKLSEAKRKTIEQEGNLKKVETSIASQTRIVFEAQQKVDRMKKELDILTLNLQKEEAKLTPLQTQKTTIETELQRMEQDKHTQEKQLTELGRKLAIELKNAKTKK